MTEKLGVLLLAFTIAGMNISSCWNNHTIAVNITDNTIEEHQDAEEEIELEVIVTRAEQVMRALFDAYPDRIEKVEFRTYSTASDTDSEVNGDWALLLRGIWYFYAGGRLLPENHLENAANYRSMQFYNYPAELPPWVERTPEESRRLSNIATTTTTTTTGRTTVQIRRSDFFLNSLWESHTQVETERRLVWVNFLGRRIRIHQLIRENLALVEAQILASVSTDPSVQTWINSIDTPQTFSWRTIAITESRSYHSYGIAIDILPRNLAGKQTYWLWTSQHRADWWNVSYNERYHPPAPVITAFETHGFIWGGKWQQFDTMHFEYRPELLILNGIMLPASPEEEDTAE